VLEFSNKATDGSFLQKLQAISNDAQTLGQQRTCGFLGFTQGFHGFEPTSDGLQFLLLFYDILCYFDIT
jgi:hypothetical protein